jgi:SAM-dependent methyltransferase
MKAKSYASMTRGLFAIVQESTYQVLSQIDNVRKAPAVTESFLHVMQIEEEVSAKTLGKPIRDLDVLNIGTGSLASQATYFALLYNRVTSIDLDITVSGFDPREYLRVAHANGPRRALKHFARTLIGFDRAFRREMARQMPAPGAKPPKLLQMDAARMTFPDASFDLVYSYDVFEHIEDLESAVSEVVRVLRPGGAACITLLPWSSEGGPHDYRTIGGHRGDLPHWAHLRPEHKDRVKPGAYVNGLGAREVKEIVAKRMQGALFIMAQPPEESELRAQLRAIRSAGELGAYTDEELLALRLQILWRKPPRRSGGDDVA